MQTIHNAQGHVFTGWLSPPESWSVPQWSPVRDAGTERAVIFPDGQAEHVARAIRGSEPCVVRTWALMESAEVVKLAKHLRDAIPQGEHLTPYSEWIRFRLDFVHRILKLLESKS